MGKSLGFLKFEARLRGETEPVVTHGLWNNLRVDTEDGFYELMLCVKHSREITWEIALNGFIWRSVSIRFHDRMSAARNNNSSDIPPSLRTYASSMFNDLKAGKRLGETGVSWAGFIAYCSSPTTYEVSEEVDLW